MASRTANVCLLVTVLGWASCPFAAAQPPAAPVVVAPVVQREVSASQTFVGTVMPVKSAAIGSAVDGRVVEFPVEEGDRVEAGQKLAQLLTETISLQLAAAEAELDLRQSRLEELRNGSRPEEIEQARARMAAARARQTYLEARSNRVRKLYRTNNAITEEELEETISAAAEAEQAFLEAKAAHELAVAGPRKETIAQAEAEVAIQQAVVEQLRDQRQKHTIISRFAGYVVAEHTEIGQWVNRGDMVAEVVALDQVEVVAQVVEQSMPFVRPGAAVRVEIPALPDRMFDGVVTKSTPRADVRARTFPVKVMIENEISSDGPLLKSGMYARVALPVGDRQQAMLVPKDAVVLGGRQPVVFVVDGADAAGGTGSVRPTPVELGTATGSLIQVIGDLNVGQLVVVEGNERLRPQQSVRVASISSRDE